MIRHLLVVLLLAAAARAADTLVVAYRHDNTCAPLYAACLNPKDFKSRYGLFLKELVPRQTYGLYDGRNLVQTVTLRPFDSDSGVLRALLDESAQVGFLQAEEVMLALLDSAPVRVIAPVSRGGDMLLVRESVPASNWSGFASWVKTQTRPVVVGYVGREPAAAFAFEQALDIDEMAHSRTTGDTTARVLLVRSDSWPALAVELRLGRLDAAAIRQPEAWHVVATGGIKPVADLDMLPPNRFDHRPGTVIAATNSSIRLSGQAISRFLELMGCATHYANNRTATTRAAALRWLEAPAMVESTAPEAISFSSMPGAWFRDGLWNWYFALRINLRVPKGLDQFMERDEWLGVPWDSSLVMPALERAGTRILR